MKKKLFGLVCIACFLALPFLAMAACDNTPDEVVETFSVQFVVAEAGIDAPSTMQVVVGEDFILPSTSVVPLRYNLYWRVFGLAADPGRQAGQPMPYSLHRTLAGGTLRMEAMFRRIPYTDLELMQNFVIETNVLIGNLSSIDNEAELRAAIVGITTRINNWDGIALADLNSSLLTQQQNRHMNMFVGILNSLIGQLEDMTDHLDDLIVAVDYIQSGIQNWPGITLVGVQTAVLNAQVERKNDWIDARNLQDFIIKINDLIADLEDIPHLFNLSHAISHIETLLYDWDGLPILDGVINLLDKQTQGLRAEYLKTTAQGPMVLTANQILDQITTTNIHPLLTSRQHVTIVANSADMVHIIIAALSFPALSIWGETVHRTDIRIFANLDDADAFEYAQNNTTQYGYVAVTATDAFSRWYFSSLVMHGAPESMFDENNQAYTQFLEQKQGISNELNRHFNRDTQGTGFSYAASVVISYTMQEPTMMVIQIGSLCTGRRVDGIRARYLDARFVIMGYVVIVANEAWADALVGGAAMRFVMGISGTQIQTSMHARAARRHVGNVAFFGEPVGLEEMIEAYLEGNPVQLNAFLSQEQRDAAMTTRNRIYDEAGFNLTHVWASPEMEIFEYRVIATMYVRIIIIFNFSNAEIAQNFYTRAGFWNEFSLTDMVTALMGGTRAYLHGSRVMLISDNVVWDVERIIWG